MSSGDGDKRDITSQIKDRLKSFLSPETQLGKLGRDTSIVITIFILIGVVSFLFTGIFYPYTSVASGSMEPNLERGDLVVSVDVDRTESPNQVQDTGITPKENTTTYTSFGDRGHVIIYTNNDGTQIIHRAIFWVEEGENWYEKADKEYVGKATDCESMRNCPAPNSGFITKGDANTQYDQSAGLSKPVSTQNIDSVAWFKIPFIGYIGLFLSIFFFGVFKGTLSHHFQE